MNPEAWKEIFVTEFMKKGNTRQAAEAQAAEYYRLYPGEPPEDVAGLAHQALWAW